MATTRTVANRFLTHAARLVAAKLQRIENERAGGFAIRLDYPTSAENVPRWNKGVNSHSRLLARIADDSAKFGRDRDTWVRVARTAREIPDMLPDDLPGPRWRNSMFAGLDAFATGYFLAAGPRRYVEIGSGHSTRFARHFVDAMSTATRITSIDPYPRAECDALCDEILRTPAECVDGSQFDDLAAGDVLFFDGSHRSFMNSDVTAVLLDVLPRLAPGVLIGIHDIFLPDDYPADWADRYYNEQYMLAAYLLGAQERIRIMFPAYYVCVYDEGHPALAAGREYSSCPPDRLEGCAFWFTHVA